MRLISRRHLKIWVEMVESDLRSPKPKVHAKLSVMLSLLKAFKLVELIALTSNLLAILAILYSLMSPLKVLASLMLLVSLGIFNFALRIHIDITLFGRWDSFELSAIDEALSKINSKHKTGSALEMRLQGSYRLLKLGLLLVLV
jgi:hypothetical protein